MSRVLPTLTYRRLTILLHLEAGLGYKEIAEVLDIHPATVRGHIIAIANKLPGNGPPQDRVLLWCDRLLCAHADIVGHLRR